MNDNTVNKIKRLLLTKPDKGLSLFRDFVQEWKELPAREKKLLRHDIDELQKLSNELFLNMYSVKTKINHEVIDYIAEGSKNIITSDGLKPDAMQPIARALRFIVDGDTERAFKDIKRATGAATHRVETIVNTLRVNNLRFDNWENALSNGATEAKLVGAKYNARPWCISNLNIWLPMSEIELLDNGQGLPVKYSCGGYNCKHKYIFR